MISQSSTFLGLILNKRFYFIWSAYQHSNFFEHVKIYLRKNKQMCSLQGQRVRRSYSPLPERFPPRGGTFPLDEQCLSLWGEGKCYWLVGCGVGLDFGVLSTFSPPFSFGLQGTAPPSFTGAGSCVYWWAVGRTQFQTARLEQSLAARNWAEFPQL